MADESKKCPACAEAIQAAALICRHCQYDFRSGQAPAPPLPPPPSGGMSAMTFVIIGAVGCGVLFMVGILAALLLPAISRATTHAKMTACGSNLRQLYTMQLSYSLQFGGAKRLMSDRTGSDFWLELTRTPPPMTRPHDPMFFCPAKARPATAVGCDYRGPAADIATASPGDPVGADKIGNHGPGQGGNVLKKDGSVNPVDEADPLWVEAAAKTRP